MYFIRDDGDVVREAKEALAGGHTVELVTGPMLKDQETRQELADLVKVHGVGMLAVYSSPTAVEQVSWHNTRWFHDRFTNLKNDAALLTTPNEILRMPLVRE
jgi:hypothetical protein